MFIDRPQPPVRRTELSAHTCNSGFGLCTPKELVFKAKEYGITALAICDYYSTNAYPQFYEECKKAQIKAIYGVQVSIGDNMVTVLAKNPNGVIGINKLSSKEETAYEDLEKIKKDIITIVIYVKDAPNIEDMLIKYDYIGITNYFSVPFELLKRHEYKFVLVSNSFYLEKNDKAVVDILLGQPSDIDFVLKAPQYQVDRNSKRISYETANMIADQIEEDCYTPPNAFDYPDIISYDAFEKLVYENAHKLFGKNLPIKVSNRLEKELPIISTYRCQSVFYISYLVAKFAKENNVITQIRGSCASALVCYILGITPINPLSWSLPFETFYGSGTDINLPDIDFALDGKYTNSLIEYLKKEASDVTLIGAGTISHYNNLQILSMAYKFFQKYPLSYYEDINNTKLFKLRNTVSGGGCHPGGILIVPKGFNIYKYTPLKKYGSLNIPCTKNDFWSCLPNLYKLDILGIANCTILAQLEKATGVKCKDIPLDDKNVLSLLKDDSALRKIVKINPDQNRLLFIPDLGTKFCLEVVNITKPLCIDDLVKVNGITHGTGLWRNNLENRFAKGLKLSDCLVTRDDIYDYLVNKCEATTDFAYETMQMIRKGRGVSPYMKSSLRSLKVSDETIDFFAKVKYMFPKSHAICHTLSQIAFMYYKINYPIEFYTNYIAVIYGAREDLNKRIYVLNSKELLEVLTDTKATYDEKELAKALIEARERGYEFDESKSAFVFNKNLK